jgi:hypothetical protein
MTRGAKKRAAREQAPPEPSARILRASVTMTLEGPDGAHDVTTELPPDALALLQAVGDSDAPTIDEVATAAQKAVELRLSLLHAAPELVPEVDRLRDVLQRIPGVRAELDRRRAGRGGSR